MLHGRVAFNRLWNSSKNSETFLHSIVSIARGADRTRTGVFHGIASPIGWLRRRSHRLRFAVFFERIAGMRYFGGVCPRLQDAIEERIR